MEWTDFKNKYGECPLVNGCNYHTTWQRNRAMRFVLFSYNKATNTAYLKTRRTGKFFTTNLDSLIFIKTPCNREKALKELNN